MYGESDTSTWSCETKNKACYSEFHAECNHCISSTCMEHFIEWLAYPFVGNWVCDCCHAPSLSVVMNDTGETIAGMKSRCWCFGYFLCSDMPPIGSKRQAASQDSADQAGAERLSQAEREVSSVAYLGKVLDLCRKCWICAESVGSVQKVCMESVDVLRRISTLQVLLTMLSLHSESSASGLVPNRLKSGQEHDIVGCMYDSLVHKSRCATQAKRLPLSAPTLSLVCARV